MGTIFAVTSYNGELFICPTACRDIVPDPEFLGECIERSYQEMLNAVVKQSAVPRKPAARRKKVAARKKQAKRVGR
jgi:hypothetical protein